MEVDLEVAADLWDELTDLSVTVYDSTGHVITGYLSGKTRRNFIRILQGDRVRVEIHAVIPRQLDHVIRAHLAKHVTGDRGQASRRLAQSVDFVLVLDDACVFDDAVGGVL